MLQCKPTVAYVPGSPSFCANSTWMPFDPTIRVLIYYGANAVHFQVAECHAAGVGSKLLLHTSFADT